jgi:hypothetical protein
MKLSKNHKIILGLGIGVGLAWIFLSKNKSTEKKMDNSEDDITHLAKTREDKIEYILNNIEATQSETTSGFSGDRFEFDPTIGYAIPIGRVETLGAGNEMIISREGNYANELYFNADGEGTDNPVEGAISELNELTDLEIDVIYSCIVAQKMNQKVSISDIVSKVPIEERKKGNLSTFLNQKMNDIKSIKKSPRWNEFWSNRRKDSAKFKGFFKRKNSKSKAEKFASKPMSNATGVNREVFYNQVINRN